MKVFLQTLSSCRFETVLSPNAIVNPINPIFIRYSTKYYKKSVYLFTINNNLCSQLPGTEKETAGL